MLSHERTSILNYFLLISCTSLKQFEKNKRCLELSEMIINVELMIWEYIKGDVNVNM